MRALYLFPLCLVTLVLACQPPAPRGEKSLLPSPAAAVYDGVSQPADLRDFIPERLYLHMNPQRVYGVTLAEEVHEPSAYFAYEADPKAVLDTLAKLPFTIDAKTADAGCREINIADIPGFGRQKTSGKTAFFYDIDKLRYQGYECLKPPYRHLILIERNSRNILHRIQVI